MKHLFLILVSFVLLSQLSYSQWIQHTGIPATASVTDIEVYGEDGEHMYLVTRTGAVYHSTNCGATWSIMVTGFPSTMLINDIFRKDNILYVAGTGIYKSTNWGMNWVSAGMGITDTVVFMYSYEGTTYAVTNGSGVYMKTDENNVWTLATLNGLPANSTVTAFIKHGDMPMVGIAGGGIYKKQGQTWYPINSGLPANSTPTSFERWGYRLFAAIAGHGIYYSSNSGANWTHISDSIIATGNTFSDLVKIGSYLFVGVSGAPNAPGRGVWVSKDKGETWYPVNDSFPTSAAYNVVALAACDSMLFAGTNGAGLWYRPIEETMPDDLAPWDLTQTPIRLKSNFPNPFNPTTTISFQIPAVNNVKLTVYDVQGKEVATLVNSQLQAGNYDIVFDASHLASGIYYYTLSTDNFADTKRMVLVK